jgi:HK97 family phage portal protein
MNLNPFKWFKKAAGDASLSLDEIAANVNKTSMTELKAAKISTFYACIRDKSETAGQIPMRLYKRGDGRNRQREQTTQGRTHRIFTQQPCDYLDMTGFIEMVVACLEMRGVFYAYLERNDRGSVMNIIPFYHQRNVNPSMDVNGNVYYTYVTNDGQVRDPYSVDDLLIIRGFTYDGVHPVSPIVACATLLNIADTQENSYRELQEEGITAQMALKTEDSFTDPKAIQRLKDDWKSFRGPRGKKSIPILEKGLTPVNLKLTPQESELLGNRQFTNKQICGICRVPPHRVNVEGGNGTKSTVFELDEAYFMNVISPILSKIETSFNRIIPDGYEVEFHRRAFYIGSPSRLVESVEKEVKGGLASINEGRADLGREWVLGGDVFGIDNNNVTYGTWENLPALQAQLYGQSKQQQQSGVNDDEA